MPAESLEKEMEQYLFHLMLQESWRILWLCWHPSGWFLRCCLVYKLKYLPQFTAVPPRVWPELPNFMTINSTANAKIRSVMKLLVYSNPQEVQTAWEGTVMWCCKASWGLTTHKNPCTNRPITVKRTFSKPLYSKQFCHKHSQKICRLQLQRQSQSCWPQTPGLLVLLRCLVSIFPD